MRKENEKQTIYKISSKKHSIKRSPNLADKPKTIKNQKKGKNDSEDLLRNLQIIKVRNPCTEQIGLKQKIHVGCGNISII